MSNTTLSLTTRATMAVITALELYLSHMASEMEASAAHGSSIDFTDDADKFAAAARVKRVMEQYLTDLDE